VYTRRVHRRVRAVSTCTRPRPSTRAVYIAVYGQWTRPCTWPRTRHGCVHGPCPSRLCTRRAARGLLEIQDAKNWHFGTILQLCRAISSELRHVSTIGKKLLNSNTSSTCPDNMVNFGLLTAEICWRVSFTPANFNGFRVLAALLHGTVVVGVSQTLRRWTEGATYSGQRGHHVGHWPTF